MGQMTYENKRDEQPHCETYENFFVKQLESKKKIIRRQESARSNKINR